MTAQERNGPMGVKLVTGPVTWGVDFADSPGNPSWTTVLDEIRRSGLGALELGPVGYLPEAEHELREALESRELTAVGSFIFDDMHDPSERDRVVTEARRASRAIAAAGGGPSWSSSTGPESVVPRPQADPATRCGSTVPSGPT